MSDLFNGDVRFARSSRGHTGTTAVSLKRSNSNVGFTFGLVETYSFETTHGNRAVTKVIGRLTSGSRDQPFLSSLQIL